MQDNYVGDIGDYGKYGLLRAICSERLSLSVNWYKVVPKTVGKQDDGKYINYLNLPEIYRAYDPELFDALHNMVCIQKNRSVQRIEQEGLFPAIFFSDEIGINRKNWHHNAQSRTAGTDVIFLDPDNGLETFNMFQKNNATDKHVKWAELKAYYDRGQSVVLYQHRPQMTPKEKCIEGVIQFQKSFLNADNVMLLEFPKYTNRFYFIFLHNEQHAAFQKICDRMVDKWGRGGFCKKVPVRL